MDYSVDIFQFIRSMVSFCSRITLFICHLDYLSIVGRGVLMSPISTVLRSICSFKSFSVCLLILGALTLGA
jgi:hypothetical protein